MIDFEPTNAFLLSADKYLSSGYVNFDAIEIGNDRITIYKDGIALGILHAYKQIDFAAGETLTLKLIEGNMKIQAKPEELYFLSYRRNYDSSKTKLQNRSNQRSRPIVNGSSRKNML